MFLEEIEVSRSLMLLKCFWMKRRVARARLKGYGGVPGFEKVTRITGPVCFLEGF